MWPNVSAAPLPSLGNTLSSLFPREHQALGTGNLQFLKQPEGLEQQEFPAQVSETASAAA